MKICDKVSCFVKIWRAVLLKLIVWLNLNETFGLRDKLAVACRLFMIAAVSSQFSAISACARTSHDRLVYPRSRPAVDPFVRSRARGKPVRGTQLTPSRKRFLSRNAVWRRQFISRRAPSRFPAGRCADVVINRALDARYPAPYAGGVSGRISPSQMPFSFACDGCPIRRRTAGLATGHADGGQQAD